MRHSHGQLWLVRTFIGPCIEKLLPLFKEDAAAFVSTMEQTKGGFSKGVMEGHVRGCHWFSICGHDQNSRSVRVTSSTPPLVNSQSSRSLLLSLSACHLTNHKAIDQLWTPGGPVSQIRQA